MNMAKFLRITDPRDLDTVHDIIHDCYFDVADIVFDSPAGLLSFKFRKLITRGRHGWKDFFFTSRTLPAVECFLRFSDVELYQIDDTEKVGSYDFNVLKYDPREKCISVLTGIPIKIKIRVKRFDVSVEVTDNAFEPIQRRGAEPLARQG
jgi:hypothetical protein